MIAIRTWLLAAALASTPAMAQERWTHSASGASLPRTFETQSIKEQRDLGSPNDSVVDYEAEAGTESTTIYIFKASVPNARLWFDRAMPTVASQIPLALFDVGPMERVTAFGSSASNGLRQVFVAKQAGPFRTTALVVAQSGPWIVKVRATSATLDRAGLQARLDRHLGAMGIVAPAFAAGLDAPPRCKAAPRFGDGKPVTSDANTAALAAAAGLVAHVKAHGRGTQICLADDPNPRFTLLGDAESPTTWLLLMGDAGRAIGVEPIEGAPAEARQLVYVSSPAATRGAALFDSPPSLQAAAQAAAPLLRDTAAGMFSISTSARPD